MKPWGYVYETVNLVNGRMYVGKRRCKQGGLWHPSYLGSGTILKRAVKKHGRGSFIVSVIDWAFSEEELNQREIQNIADYRAEYGADRMYNISSGGDSSFSGVERTPEHNAKIGKAQKNRRMSQSQKDHLREINTGKKASPKARANMSASRLGKPHVSPEGKERCRQANLGKVLSPETRAKISAARKGFVLSPEHKAKLLAANLGRKHTEDHIAKRVAKTKGRKNTPETIAKMKLAGHKRAMAWVDRMANGE
jgi:group I intron endonuclease